ncbi:MAG: glycoside hydrolase family 65 protein [Candidatus Aminicenantes bacterium]|nr:glycoside hydrolase family 65 protein [Candidatus Aminicenantes bacterium]
MHDWIFSYTGFSPKEEGLREALCTLGNGYFATRGAAPESEADDIHYPGTYLAGGYNRLTTKIAGKEIENEDLVNIPNWLPLNFRVKGENWFSLKDVEILAYRQELNLTKGILSRMVKFRDKKQRKFTLVNQRFVHMGNPHLAAIKVNLISENWSGEIEICSALDGRVINAGVKRYKALSSRHLETLEASPVDGGSMLLEVQTNQSHIRIAQCAATHIYSGNQRLEPNFHFVEEKGYIAKRFTLKIEKQERISIEKIVALYTSRDHAISECSLEAAKTIKRAESYLGLLQSHFRAWSNLWRRFEIEISIDPPDGDSHKQLVMNLYIFHLLQTTSPHTLHLDAGVPSRGWHGEAYRGHIFWDELFIFPTLNYRLPEITRSLLMYRFRRLSEARYAAQAEGFKGAMYPWQSGSNGREESQRIHLNPKSQRWIPDNSRLQRHVSSAIAYNIWSYYQVTDDMEFLNFYGAEMFLEIARFWGSCAVYNPDSDRFEISEVMGPDEYHDSFPGSDSPGLKNNAYTNVMAVWVLKKALMLLDLLAVDRKKELCCEIGLEQEEIDRWKKIIKKMRIVFHGDGIISQFEGYDQLEEFDWECYREKYGDIQRLDRILEAEGDSPNHYKVSKQADVLMLFYLFSAERLEEIFTDLGYPFDEDTIPKNIQYYLQRTSHGSTLSRVVHSWVLARADRTRSWELFEEALKSDVADIQGGTTPEGIHLGAMAGTVDLIQRCYTDMSLRENVLRFNPQLPEEMDYMSMLVSYRDHSLRVEIDPKKMRIKAIKVSAKPIKIGYNEKLYDLEPGKLLEITL